MHDDTDIIRIEKEQERQYEGVGSFLMAHYRLFSTIKTYESNRIDFYNRQQIFVHFQLLILPETY